ncbi:hypothetical protein M0804_004492 [Polistes exclamans]|nr:hypothetical protein M0804_004492 [Polistes exclamans]
METSNSNSSSNSSSSSSSSSNRTTRKDRKAVSLNIRTIPFPFPFAPTSILSTLMLTEKTSERTYDRLNWCAQSKYFECKYSNSCGKASRGTPSAS